MFKIGLATSSNFALLTENERALIPMLNESGINAEPVVWDDGNINFTDYDYIVIRSCWNYHLKIKSFRNWLSELNQAGISLANPYSVLASNTSKVYLKTLANKGVNIVATEWFTDVSPLNVLKVMAENGWSEAVLKPVVSASALHTYLISENQPPPTLNNSRNRQFMLQPFLPEVANVGEWSLIFFNKVFSHAVLKKPKKGDFRLQEELGGASSPANPSTSIISQAQKILHTYKERILYARVDGIVREGIFQLIELELIEPELFLLNDSLRKRFVTAIKEFMSLK